MHAALEPSREFVQEVALRGVQRLHLEQAAMVLRRDGEASAEFLEVSEREFHTRFPARTGFSPSAPSTSTPGVALATRRARPTTRNAPCWCASGSSACTGIS